jgi:carbonic anhydrase
MLLARADGEPAGVVALRELEPGICEMKRLFVRPAFRGLRTRDGHTLGRALVFGILSAARALGHRRMRLDTIGGQMEAAIRLYRSIGFVEIPAYYPSPVPGTVYLELLL